MNPATIEISHRQKTTGPNHHLWLNHGIWWFHGTFHLSNGTAERKRVNLGTTDLHKARIKRDHLIAYFSQKTLSHVVSNDRDPSDALAITVASSKIS